MLHPPTATSRPRTSGVCENWYAMTDKGLMPTRMEGDRVVTTTSGRTMFLMGASGLELDAGSNLLVSRQPKFSISEGFSTNSDQLTSPPLFADIYKVVGRANDDINDVERVTLVREEFLKMRQALCEGDLTEEMFIKYQHHLKQYALSVLRDRVHTGKLEYAVYQELAGEIISIFRSANDCEVRLCHTGTQQESLDLLVKLRRFLDSDSETQSVLTEVVKSRFVMRSRSDSASDSGHGKNNSLGNNNNNNNNNHEINSNNSLNDHGHSPSETAKKHAEEAVNLLLQLREASTVPGVNLAERNLTKCEKTVQAIIQDVQQDQPDVAVPDAMIDYLRKYALLSEQIRVWLSQSKMEAAALKEAAKSGQQQSFVLAKEQERQIVKVVEEKDMLDKRLRIMEQKSRAKVSDFALKTQGTLSLKERIKELETEVVELQEQLRCAREEFGILNDASQVSQRSSKSMHLPSPVY